MKHICITYDDADDFEAPVELEREDPTLGLEEIRSAPGALHLAHNIANDLLVSMKILENPRGKVWAEAFAPRSKSI